MSSQAFFPTFQTQWNPMDMIVYRVLRPDENPEYLIAKDPFAKYSVYDHVSNGYLNTQFISTCKSKAAVKYFAELGKPYAKTHGTTGLRKIVSINLTKLMQLVPSKIIDLTLPGELNSYIPIIPPYIPGSKFHSKARNCATQVQEVLIKLRVIETVNTTPIPAECVTLLGCV
ncbi:uncharacterized protein LOC132733811 isoform X1 [Ruditapes philippinarum]|uniref:uncharacterized protein LOC132733811 isoform X1 n=1 Tax=Ruditapes philippinarum TaxID=129788 RepID=UPI00295BF0D5|nr:uncharacterized protein LOC132733811 isoform X1 [Ruditapes philippinarum]XP_060576481.1 uncharacterized protein LOC132733811 isoform X1 [Ruditapes philippinarum]